MHRSSILALLLLVAFAATILSPADARTRRRRAPRTPPRPSGVVRVLIFDPADPAASPATGYRTVRLLDAYGGKWERRVDSTAVVTFAGVPPGQAIVSWWTPPGDSVVAAADTAWIVAGRTAEATLRLRRAAIAPPAASHAPPPAAVVPPSHASQLNIVVMSRNDRELDRAAPLARAFIRVVDAAGVRHEAFADDDGHVTFSGVAPGRATRIAWLHGDLPDRSDPIGTDTVLVGPGARVDTMRVTVRAVAGEGGTR